MERRILLVDDEPALRYSVGEFLGRVGYDVTAAEGGAQALEALMASPPDLVISDVMMEGMDGFEFQRRVHALTGAGMPFIFLTAKGDLRDRLEGLRGGADDYVVKPFEPEELEARVASLLGRVERTRQEERRELDALRARILSEVSERMRAPVESLSVRLSALLSERYGDDPDLQADYLRAAADDAETLRELAESLATVADATSAEMPIQREPMRVAPLVRAAAAEAAHLAAVRGVRLEIACGGLLSASVDREALTRALAALLEVSVALSPPGSEVRIAARRAQEGGLDVAITDGGAAPADDSMEPSEEARAALDLARRVVHAHGGVFTARLEGERHTITIWLPGRVAKHIGRRT